MKPVDKIINLTPTELRALLTYGDIAVIIASSFNKKTGKPFSKRMIHNTIDCVHKTRNKHIMTLIADWLVCKNNFINKKKKKNETTI